MYIDISSCSLVYNIYKIYNIVPFAEICGFFTCGNQFIIVLMSMNFDYLNCVIMFPLQIAMHHIKDLLSDGLTVSVTIFH